MTEPRIIPPGGGSVAAIRNFATVTKVSGEDSGGQYSVLAARTGATVFIPAGTPHTMWNARPEDPKERGGRGPGEPARFLAIVVPGGLERYYEKVASFVRDGAKPDVPSILAVSAEHGVEVDMLSLLDIIERHKVELA